MIIVTDTDSVGVKLQPYCVCTVQTWLRMSVAFLALMKSGVSVARASIPLPLISCSSAFLYSLCKTLRVRLLQPEGREKNFDDIKECIECDGGRRQILKECQRKKVRRN